MGGESGFNTIGQQTWEEAKCSDDDIFVCRLHNLFVEQTLYTCFAIGLFAYLVLMYIFLQREHAHITSNPEVQWHLKEIKKEEEEFKAEVKVRYVEEQRKRRHKRREYMKKYNEEQMTSMDPVEREKKLAKEQKKKEQQIMHEQILYRQVLENQNRILTTEEDKYLRQLIRKDVKEYAKIQRYQDSDYSETDEEQRIEDKVQYGSDSESDVPSESPYLDYQQDDDVYGPEEDMDFDEQQEDAEIDMGDELAFDEVSDEKQQTYGDETPRNSDTVEKLVDTSDSNTSQDVITESIDSSHSNLEGPEEQKVGQTLEMVDLRKQKVHGEMREFKPQGLVNHSKKKREKRKAKKEELKRVETEKEAKRLAKELKKQQELQMQQLQQSDSKTIMTTQGKILKKKVIPKKKVLDDKGEEWEVIDKKKTMIVEESQSDEEESELSD